MIKITQGEACDIECTIVADDNEATEITPDNVEHLRIKLGKLEKTWPDGDLFYDDAWIFQLTQEDTLRMKGLPVLSARARFSDGSAPACDFGVVKIVKGHDRRTV